MTEQDQIRVIAELDGIGPKVSGYYCKHPTEDRICMQADFASDCDDWLAKLPKDSPYKNWIVVEDLIWPPYLTSRDAICGVIEKHGQIVMTEIGMYLFEQSRTKTVSEAIFTATPAMLCEALLRVTNKWK